MDDDEHIDAARLSAIGTSDINDHSKLERDDTPSSLDSSGEQELDQEPVKDNAPPQKRKGGRKPVRSLLTSIHCVRLMSYSYMQRQRNANKEIDKHRLHFVNDGRNI